MHGETFNVHKDVITQDCLYFQIALSNPNFIEGQTQTIDIDDVPDETFGLYLSVAYTVALSKTPVVLPAQTWDDTRCDFYTFGEILRLWQLANRFLNHKVEEVVKTALDSFFDGYNIGAWLYRYKHLEWQRIRKEVEVLQEGFRICKKDYIPFGGLFVEALSNCPSQVFEKIIADLDDDFRCATTQAFARRFADPRLTQKRKRYVGDEEETQEPAKGQEEN